jgi:hypothetical protein
LTVVVVVASGPSFTEDQAQRIIAAREQDKCRVIVVNRSWERVPNADVLYAADAKWWRRYWPEVERGFRGECWTCTKDIADELGLCYIAIKDRAPGLSKDPTCVHHGNNSGYQAINLAYRFGATRILLVGYDMQFAADGRHHFHDDYKDEIVNGKKVRWTNASGVQSWIPFFGPLADDLRAAGVKTMNCSESTSLTCFEKARLEDVL